MTTHPGGLVLDPTCGSGTTLMSRSRGRITIDTSRVAIALVRQRLMRAKLPCYLLADSVHGQAKEAELTETVPDTSGPRGDVDSAENSARSPPGSGPRWWSVTAAAPFPAAPARPSGASPTTSCTGPTADPPRLQQPL
jgi:hypothetical protein